ncbi:hypothetical protein EJB05_09748, partial [Eragrostis curvula]
RRDAAPSPGSPPCPASCVGARDSLPRGEAGEPQQPRLPPPAARLPKIDKFVRLDSRFKLRLKHRLGIFSYWAYVGQDMSTSKNFPFPKLLLSENRLL